MDSPGPQQSQFDIFELTWTSRVRKGLLAPNSKICTFVTKPIIWVSVDSSGPQQLFGGVTRIPMVQIWVQGPFGTKFKNLHFCHKTPQYGCLWTRLGPSNFLGGDSDPGGPNLGPRVFWRQIQKSALFSQNPTIWVSMDSPGPQQSFFR